MVQILVGGATGNVGAKVVHALSGAPDVHSIRALVRDVSSDKAKGLASLPKTTLVKGDFTDKASILTAMEGCQRAFLVCVPGDDSQYDLETTFLAAAKEKNLECVVRISTAAALISLESTGVYARAHAKIEKYIAENKVACIDLQPNWFMSNWLGSAAEIKGTGKITWPVPASCPGRFAAIDTRDVASAAATLLSLPSEKLKPFLEVGQVEVHGPAEITFADKAAAVAKAIGKDKVEINYLEPNAWAGVLQSYGMSEAFAQSFKDTVLIIGGVLPPTRPLISKSTPLLAEVWQPKFTVEKWAEDHKEAFM